MSPKITTLCLLSSLCLCAAPALAADFVCEGDAQRTYDCPDVVAATLWVLDKSGKL